MRFRGGIADLRFTLGKHSGHDRIFSSGNTGFIQKHICAV